MKVRSKLLVGAVAVAVIALLLVWQLTRKAAPASPLPVSPESRLPVREGAVAQERIPPREHTSNEEQAELDPVIAEATEEVVKSREEISVREQLRLHFLAMLPPATDGAERLIPEDFQDSSSRPSLSPDGKYVAAQFYYGDDTADVYLYSLEDRSFTNLTRDIRGKGNIPGGPVFSPDGRSVLVCVGLPRSVIWQVDVETGDAQVLVDAPGALAPKWSSDGRYITYAVIGRPDGTSVEVYDTKERKVIRSFQREGEWYLTEPSFSPDGKYLVCTKRTGGDSSTRRRILYLQPLDGTEGRAVEFADHDVHTPVFSPDGKYVAYRGGTSAWGEIYVYSVDEGTERKVTSGGASGPCWLPDSSGIVFSSGRETGISRLYRLDISEEEKP